MTVVRYVVLPHGNGLSPPSYNSSAAAGLDLKAAVQRPLILGPSERALVPTGIAIEIPPGFEGQVRPRSGLAHDHGITVLNSPGTIDSDYRGELQVLLINLGNEPWSIGRGERVAQLVIAPIERVLLEPVKELSQTVRGSGGFGSTGTS